MAGNPKRGESGSVALLDVPAPPHSIEAEQAVLGGLLLDLNRSGQSLVLVTHNPELAARYARRTVAMVDGRIASDTGGLAGGDSSARVL